MTVRIISLGKIKEKHGISRQSVSNKGLVYPKLHLVGMLMMKRENFDEGAHLEDSICSLVDSARNGCEKSQADLIKHLQSYMALVATKKMNPKFQAKFGESDIVQQSIAVAIEKFPDFGGSSKGELFAWVKAILQNQLLQNQRALLSDKRDMFREQRIQSTPSGHVLPGFVDRYATPGSEAIRQEHTTCVEAALQNLPEEYRTVIRLRNWEQLSFPEIGKRMNRTANAATKLWYRALIELRKSLSQLEESNDETR